MSRIGKKPIPIPNNVKVKVEGNVVAVSGPKGNISWNIPEGISCAIENNSVVVKRENDLPQTRAKHGLVRAKIANMVNGVINPFVKMLDIVGVGYRAELNGRKIVLNLGFSHPVEVSLPDGIDAKIEKQTRIVLSGIVKEDVGEFAAYLRRIKPPDSYKGKGIRYADEKITLKPGKAATAAGAGGATKA